MVSALGGVVILFMLLMMVYRGKLTETYQSNTPNLQRTQTLPNELVKRFKGIREKEYVENFDYQAAMNELNNEKVAQDDPRLIKLIRDYYIEPPSELPYNLKILDRHDYSRGQAPFVDSRLNYMVGCFFSAEQ